jgi:hypothetical protein
MKLKSALTLTDASVVVGGSRLGQSPFLWLRQFVTRRIVGAAPEDSAICEFDCRKIQCPRDEWEACERRIRKGAGELLPVP